MKIVDGVLTLSATDLSAHAACSHLTELRLREHLDGGEKEPRLEGAGTRALRERGLRHEQEYLEYLRRSGREILDLGFGQDDTRPSHEKIREALERTAAAVAAHVDVIAQARFQGKLWGGSADVLLWDAGQNRYRIVDTKLSRETRGGTILQLLVYAELLDEIADQVTDLVGVVAPGRDFEPEWHRISEYGAYFRLAKQRLMNAVVDRPATYPELVEHCAVCNWWQRCARERRADDHLSLVAGMTRSQRREAGQQGVTTLESFAVHDAELWTPRHGSLSALKKAHRQAGIQLKGRREGMPVFELLPRDLEGPRPSGLAMLPEPNDGDLFFDIEGDRFAGEDGIEYLFGTVDLRGDYAERWATNSTAERAMFETFIDEMSSRTQKWPGMHIFHFGHYEVSALKRLAQRYGTREHELDVLLREFRFVDLLRVVKTSLIASVEGYSIKLLEPLYSFVRQEDLERSRENRRLLEIELEQGTAEEVPQEMLSSIRDYNREDCLSTNRLRDWLESLREGLVEGGEEIPRPQPDEYEEDEQKRDPELQQLMDRLIDDVPADPRERTAEQQTRALLAALMEYHHRERRNAWWEFISAFARDDDEEHLEAGNTIGDLEFIEEIPPAGRQRNSRLRFKFPPQRIDVMGDQVFWAMDFKDGLLGSIERLSRDLGELLVSVKPERARLRPAYVVIAPPNVHQNQVKAIRTVASAVADKGFAASGFPAAIDLLLRKPPIITTGEGRSAGESTNEPVERACTRAEALDQGVLAIQGPPGTGKTFTAAHVIARLVASKKKIGVCALSHAAIDGLLSKISSEAPTVRAAHVSAELKIDEAMSSVANDELDVVGATSFQWCKESVRGTIDVLVIEEAGQLSLADAIAASTAARSLILLGDPRQLQAPQQGAHPEGSGAAALEHFMGSNETIPEELGLFLDRTRRLSRPIASYTSDLFYEGRLQPFDDDVATQLIEGDSRYAGAGLRLITVEHDGNTSHSPEEVSVVGQIVEELLAHQLVWRYGDSQRAISLEDILIVAPYNAQVNAIRERIPGGRVGTVDKFQGQEAPVVVISLATSRPEDAPHGMEFLYSRNRLNVASSRARCSVILVCSPAILQPECRTPRQMRLANGYAAFVEAAQEHESIGSSDAGS